MALTTPSPLPTEGITAANNGTVDDGHVFFNVSSPSFFYDDGNVTCFWECWNVTALREQAREPGVMDPDMQYFVGLLLAICSSVFIGASFIIKKKSLLRLSAKAAAESVLPLTEPDSTVGKRRVARAADGGMGYLSDWVWWLGLLSMGVGEAANFAAYAFVPASLVTPLGALSVVVTAVLASYFLGERLNVIGKLACLLCLLGSTVTILHAPKEGEVTSLTQLAGMLSEPAFISYLLVVVVVTLVFVFFLAPKWGNSNVFVYVLTCSVVGSLSVMSVKAVGIALVETASPNGPNDFKSGLTYIFLAALLVTVSVQMIYLNKALDVFNTSVVSPIYYVFFTAFVMIASGILYEEFGNLSAVDIVGLAMGFSVIVVGVFLLHLFKDFEITLSDVSYVFGPQAPKPSSRLAATSRQAAMLKDYSSSSSGGSSVGGGGEKALLLPKTLPVRTNSARGNPDRITSVSEEEVVGEIVLENQERRRSKKEKKNKSKLKEEVKTATLVEVESEEADSSWVMNRDVGRLMAESAYVEEKRRKEEEKRRKKREREEEKMKRREREARARDDEADSGFMAERALGLEIARARYEEAKRKMEEEEEGRRRESDSDDSDDADFNMAERGLSLAYAQARLVESKRQKGEAPMKPKEKKKLFKKREKKDAAAEVAHKAKEEAKEKGDDQGDFNMAERGLSLAYAQAKLEESKRQKGKHTSLDNPKEKKKVLKKKEKKDDAVEVVKKAKEEAEKDGDDQGDFMGERGFGLAYAQAKYDKNQRKREEEGKVEAAEKKEKKGLFRKKKNSQQEEKGEKKEDQFDHVYPTRALGAAHAYSRKNSIREEEPPKVEKKIKPEKSKAADDSLKEEAPSKNRHSSSDEESDQEKEKREGAGDTRDSPELAIVAAFAQQGGTSNRRPEDKEKPGEQEKVDQADGASGYIAKKVEAAKSKRESRKEKKEEFKKADKGEDKEEDKKEKKNEETALPSFPAADVADRGSFGMEMAAGIRASKEKKKEKKEKEKKKTISDVEEKSEKKISDDNKEGDEGDFSFLQMTNFDTKEMGRVLAERKEARKSGKGKRKDTDNKSAEIVEEAKKEKADQQVAEEAAKMDDNDQTDGHLANWSYGWDLRRKLKERRERRRDTENDDDDDEEEGEKAREKPGKDGEEKKKKESNGNQKEKEKPEVETKDQQEKKHKDGDDQGDFGLPYWSYGGEMTRKMKEKEDAKTEEKRLKEKEDRKEAKEKAKDKKKDKADSVVITPAEVARAVSQAAQERARRKAAEKEKQDKANEKIERVEDKKEEKESKKSEADGNVPVKLDPAVVQVHSAKEKWEKDEKKKDQEKEKARESSSSSSSASSEEEEAKDDPDGLKKAKGKVMDAIGSAQKSVGGLTSKEKKKNTGKKGEAAQDDAIAAMERHRLDREAAGTEWAKEEEEGGGKSAEDRGEDSADFRVTVVP